MAATLRAYTYLHNGLRGFKVKFSFVLNSFSNSVLMKVDKYHKVSNLTLKWCKMSFYFILFQCEIWNMTSLDVNNKWVCTFHTEILHSSKSQIQPRFDWISWRFRNELKIPHTMYRPIYLKCDVIGCFWMLTNFALEGYHIQWHFTPF